MKNIPLNEVTYYDDFRQMIAGLADRYEGQVALSSFDRKGNMASYTYREFYTHVFSFAHALQSRGLAGAHIAIAGENSYFWLVAYFGTAICGGVAVCIDIEQSDDIVRDMILQADAVGIVTSANLLPVVRPVIDQGNMKLVVTLDGQDPGFITVQDFCELGRDQISGGEPLPPLDKNQTAAIVYTSGTTSIAKPVMLSHYAICTNTGDALRLVSPPKKSFAALPFYHAYGMMCAILSALCTGVGIGINGDLKKMARDLQLYRPGVIIAVPLMVEMLHKMIWDQIDQSGKRKVVRFFAKLFRAIGRPGLLRKYILKKLDESSIGNVSMILCGGAYLAQDVGRDMVSFGITVLQGYGITECAPTVSVNSNHDFDVATVGHVLEHYEVKISDGEILVRGDSMMNGYYKNEALTREAFQDGWFKTGDLGYLDARGHLIITGRKKNLVILKNGKKISAEEIETYLLKLPLVKEVMAYGASSGNSTDDVKLAVMVYPDPQQTQGLASYEILSKLQAEVDTLNATLPTYKQIQMVNIRSSEFEKTSSRKIKRY